MKFQTKPKISLSQILTGVVSNSYTGCLVLLVVIDENLVLLLMTEEEESYSCIALCGECDVFN